MSKTSWKSYLGLFVLGALIAAVGLAAYSYLSAPEPAPQSLAMQTASDQPETGSAVMTVYKSPTCGCCAKWIDHLEADGFMVEVRDVGNLGEIKQEMGVPRNMSSCHTGRIGDYVIEGHVPAEDIRRLLVERPDVHGLAVPGMPIGSPGMEQGGRQEAYKVYAFAPSGSSDIFAQYEARQ